jgi:biopolymer transport protein ExbD
VVEQFDVKIKLPPATMAKSLEAREGNLLYLNVNEKGHVSVLDRRDDLTTPNDVERYLVNKYKDELAKARREQKDAKEPTTLIIIRGDRNATCDKIYVILRSCKLAGFTRVQLRVLAEQGA